MKDFVTTTIIKDMKRQTKKVGVAGSFQNQMMGNNSSVPEVGKGATILMYSDRHAYEVISVSEDGNQCTIRAMKCIYTGSGYGDESYRYESNENAVRKDLEWNEKKQCWGSVYYDIHVINALVDRLYKKHGYDWRHHLAVPYEELIDGKEDGIYTKLKLVKGVTKKYKIFNRVSVIFGIMDQYCDPSF